MAPSVKDGTEALRRKSMSLLSRPLASLTQINTDISSDESADGTKDKRKSKKRVSILPRGFGHSASSDSVDGAISPTSINGSSQPRSRPRTLQKNRPSSIFGSLGRRSMNNVEEDGEMDNLASSAPDSPLVDGLGSASPFDPSLLPSAKSVRHHGEVQTASGMFRKKKEYLVLTDTHLIRFKSQSRASEIFPSIRPTFGRSAATRHPSTTSVGSLHEVQSIHSHTSAEGENRIPLEQIVSSYRVEDGRPFFTAEVVWLDEKYHGVGSIQLILHDPEEADLWLSSIRGASQKARLLQEEPYPQRVIQYLASIVDSANDYDTAHFQVFRVVRRQTAAKGKTSSDDLSKVGSSVYYMVIGRYNVHLIPVPDFSDANGRLLVPKARRHAYGIVTLYSMNINNKGEDDRFELGFRMPLQDLTVIDLASYANPDITIALYRAWQYLKPLWSDWTFLWNGAESQLRTGEPEMDFENDDWFDRTLVAYCIAYGCNPGNIQYAVDLDCEDAPQFKLCPPSSTAVYSLYELLSIMRALRYNEEFKSISFRDINLHNLHGVHDVGTDHMAHTASDGRDISRYTINSFHRSLLYREIQAIALKSKTLRRLDFGNCLPKRRPKDTYDLETGAVVDKDPGCEVVGAVLALCKEQLTNVSWIVLNGIELGETDLEEMLPALNKRRSNIRAIELSRCGLSDRGIVQLLGHMERQNATIECVNISDNSGRIDLERFSASMTRFSRIRRLDISRITRTSSDKPLIAAEVLQSWKLEEFIMNGVPINEETLDSIAGYLVSPMSDNLRILQMDQCNLNGSQVAVLMRAMTRSSGTARELQLHVSANRFERGVGDIAAAIKDNCTPSTFVARMIEFEKEDHFRDLLHALRTNKTIRCLDISKASLPYDANEQTCDALRVVFAENTTLEDLDISGEHAHLEIARFGIGLNAALKGLKENTTLRVLRIEYQNLGFEGADTLAEVLETNTGLTHIYCEHNDISLQGFTTLVNALAKNYTVLNLPLMQDDQSAAMKRLSAEMREAQQQEKRERHVKSSVNRTLTKLGVNHKTKRPGMTMQDVDEVVRIMGERWSKEIERMLVFLGRNDRIANGGDANTPDGEAAVPEAYLRPTTALSDRGILEQVLSNTTPRADQPNPVDEHVNSKLGNLSVSETAYKREPSSVTSVRTSTDDDTVTKLSFDDKAASEPYSKALESGTLLNLPNIPRGAKVFDLDGEGLFDMDKEE